MCLSFHGKNLTDFLANPVLRLRDLWDTGQGSGKRTKDHRAPDWLEGRAGAVGVSGQGTGRGEQGQRAAEGAWACRALRSVRRLRGLQKGPLGRRKDWQEELGQWWAVSIRETPSAEQVEEGAGTHPAEQGDRWAPG